MGNNVSLKFSKMQGIGNDFVVIDAISQTVQLTPEQIQRLANRRLGVGCDQVLLLEKSKHPYADFRYRIFNADGAEVEQCGNGARCLGRFAQVKGWAKNSHIRLETKGGIISLHLEEGNNVTVNMGMPRFEPADIPFLAAKRAPSYSLLVGKECREVSVLSMGNPHAVQFVDDIETAPVTTEGPIIEQHSQFPAKVNAGFVQILSEDKIRVRVYERGAGETLACGTGACAAVVAGRQRGSLKAKVEVNMPGGSLIVTWEGEGHPVYLQGPAVMVFEGQIEL